MTILAIFSVVLGIKAITASPITERQPPGAPFVDLKFGPTCDSGWWNSNKPSMLTLDNYTTGNCVIIDGFPGNFKITWSVGESTVGWCMDTDCMGADGKGTCWEQGVNEILENGGCVDVEGWIQSMYILSGDGSSSS